VGNNMVLGTAGFLLHDYGQGLHHATARHGSARDVGDGSTHSFPHATTHTTAHAAPHTAAHTAAHIATHAAGTFGASGPVQLRNGCRKHLARGQETVVLQSPPPRMPTHIAASSDRAPTSDHLAGTSPANHASRPGRPLQLC